MCGLFVCNIFCNKFGYKKSSAQNQRRAYGTVQAAIIFYGEYSRFGFCGGGSVVRIVVNQCDAAAQNDLYRVGGDNNISCLVYDDAFVSYEVFKLKLRSLASPNSFNPKNDEKTFKYR